MSACNPKLFGLLALAGIAHRGGTGPLPDFMPPEVFNDTFQDVAKLDPGHYKVEFENEQIRVLRLVLKGNNSVPLHDDRSAWWCASPNATCVSNGRTASRKIFICSLAKRGGYGMTPARKRISVRVLWSCCISI